MGGDGSADSVITSDSDPDITHTYVTSGDYTVTIKGIVEAWYFNNAGDKDKIISVANLGYVGWINLEKAFYGCSNMTLFAGGNTANVTNMSYIFYDVSSLTTLDLASFDTANVTDISWMFSDAFLNKNAGLVVTCNQGGSPATGTFFTETCQ